MQKKLLTTLAAISFLAIPIYSYAQTIDGSPTTSQEQDAQAQTNKQVGDAFLAKNKTKPGISSFADGLQYRVLKPGSGPKPGLNDTVTVQYAGRLINGQEFDSSYKRGEPVSFPVSGVIQGWIEALQHMNKGAVWELYVPAKLAYGERGAAPYIGPNETLIFKVELLDVKK